MPNQWKAKTVKKRHRKMDAMAVMSKRLSQLEAKTFATLPRACYIYPRV